MTLPVEDRAPEPHEIVLQVQGERVLLDRFPIVLTKDRSFAERASRDGDARPGRIYVLPADAVLVMLPEDMPK